MKNNSKKLTMIIIALVVGAVVSAGSFAVAGPLNRAYYSRHFTSIEKIKAIYGNPVKVNTLENGTKMMIYPAEDIAGTPSQPVFYVKDGRVVDAGMM